MSRQPPVAQHSLSTCRRHPGAPGRLGDTHPRLQHVVVAQGLGLADQLTLVLFGDTAVAWHPVLGGQEPPDKVGAMVVDGTLLLPEGEGCWQQWGTVSTGGSPQPPAQPMLGTSDNPALPHPRQPHSRVLPGHSSTLQD